MVRAVSCRAWVKPRIHTEDTDMATWTPDASCYPSPRLASGAPPEKHAYVAEFDPQRRRPDRLVVR